MKAVMLRELGGPQKLFVEEVADPKPAPNEVLIRVRAAALNHRDLFITRGLYPKIVLPAILGSDGAGEVAALGEEVRLHRVGEHVVVDPMLGWGPNPAIWDDSGSILGMPHHGTLAQYVCVPEENVHPKPLALSMEEAAAIPLGGLTAYRALFTRGRLQRGETVLITGVGGGVQTFVLLFAKRAGARAIVTSSSDQKLSRARTLGADVALNYVSDAAWERSAKASGPIDIAVDSSGGDTLGRILRVIRPGGRVVIYGGTNADATIKLFPLFWNHVTIMGTSMGNPEDFRSMLELFSGDLKPAVDRVYSMNDIAEAMQRMEQSEQFGKIVVRIPN